MEKNELRKAYEAFSAYREILEKKKKEEEIEVISEKLIEMIDIRMKKYFN
jgi:hypothetical protein